MTTSSPTSTPRPLPAAAPATLDVGAALALLFFVSGAAALMYQVALIRAFVELFGSTSGATGAIVGAFLACLALGSLAAGWLADRIRRPLRMYALLEATAALGGVLAWWFVGQLDRIAESLAVQTLGGESVALVRMAVVLGVLLLPVGALGATLPILSVLRRRHMRRGRAAGSLQMANTLGGVAGVLLASFWAVPVLGLGQAILLPAALNLGIALVVGLGLARGESPVGGGTAAAPVEHREGRVSPWPFWLASLCMGFTVVALEVVLLRGLQQVTRGSLDSLGMLLSMFLLCQGVGTGLGVLWSRHRPRSGFLHGHLWTAVAILWSLKVLYTMASEAPWGILLWSHEATSLSGRALGEALTALVLVGPAALASGLAFPCVAQLRPKGRLGFGAWVAVLVGTWTVGAAVAGVLAPSRLIPYWHLSGSLWFLLAVVLVPVGVAVAIERSSLWKGTSRSLLAPAGGLLLVVLAVGGPTVLSEPLRFFRLGLAPGSQLLRYGEGPMANVAVVGLPDDRKVLKVNNLHSLGGSGAEKVEGIQALLPAALAGEPKRALVLGVGAGVTVGMLHHYGVEHIDAVEVAPLVLGMLPMFEYENGGLLQAAQRGDVVLHAEDARTFVRGAEESSYDLIIGDLFFPWQTEAGFLYTQEHFERIRRLLKPDGVFCQWLPGHQMRWQELSLVGRTFADVFRGSSVWLARPDFLYPVLALVAGKEGLEIDVERIQATLDEPARKPVLGAFGLTEADRLLALYVGDEYLFRDREDSEPVLNTIDRPLVEFASARRVTTDEVQAINNRQRLYERREDVVGRVVTRGMKAADVSDLRRRVSRISSGVAELFHVYTLLVLADVNRSLPAELRSNDPDDLELKSFQVLGEVLRQVPELEDAEDHMVLLLERRLRRQEFGSVVEATSALLTDPLVGARARFHNLRGMALLLADCVGASQEFQNPLGHAATEFRAALEVDPGMVQAGIHLGLAEFLRREDGAARVALSAAREQIVAPNHPDGHALPDWAEAMYQFLEGDLEQAHAILETLPAMLPYVERIQARILTG